MTAALSLAFHLCISLLAITSSSRARYSDALSFASSSSPSASPIAAATRGRTTTTVNIPIFFAFFANRCDLSTTTATTVASSPPLSVLFSSFKQQDASSLSTDRNNALKKLRNRLPILEGDWTNAKSTLRDPNCCVVTISNIQQHISILQEYFCGENVHSDLDLRMRVRGCRPLDEADEVNEAVLYRDCEMIYNAVMVGSNVSPSLLPLSDGFVTQKSNKNYDCNDDDDNDNTVHSNGDRHHCIMALAELARGMASLTDGKRLAKAVTDVHVRVVSASNYAASDPMFHTDKCPLRGYVTLTGPGTEYMQETCLPWEYVALRSSGAVGLNRISGNNKATRSLKMARELEFIVMKGDEYYEYSDLSPSIVTLPQILWNRSSACVHRSPPGSGKRRVILSLDLADGKDNQEWYEVGRRREWRSGMTQRKSRLVS